MSKPNDSEIGVQTYLTSPYPCSYIGGRQARSQVVAPPQRVDRALYSQLVAIGFRRSGDFAYRPLCDACSACIPIRLLVDHLQINRSMRRCLKINATVTARDCPLDMNDEHAALYERYQWERHRDNDADDLDSYRQLLLKSRVDTRLVEFRENNKLLMVSIIDCVTDGLSAVYTFYEPYAAQRSLGVYNIVWQAREAQRLSLPYLYLGYWIAESQKMAYKSNFHPHQCFIDGRWQGMAG